MPSPTFATRRFDEADQAHFARLTGDVNPMHMDPVAARRTQAGAPTVHGMHSALWALDAASALGLLPGPMAGLRVTFLKFVYVGATLSLRVSRQSGTALVIALDADGVAAATISIRLGEPAATVAPALSAEAVTVEDPAILDLGDVTGRHGLLPELPGAGFEAAFPALAGAIGASRVKTLAQFSTLVGMVCPGLHSIFASLDVALDGSRGGVAFRVAEVDERFRMADIAVAGGGLGGTLTAFVRHPPIEQPTIADLAGVVAPGEFKSVTALVIGGSRGLGALTARMLAAGGARVALTFASGEDEARIVADDIVRHAGPNACRVLRYDARREAGPQLSGLDWPVDQLYYFATTRIFRQKAVLYQPSEFAEFAQVYVDGFHGACMALRAGHDSPLTAFYPSSIAVEEHPQDMCEYSMAKAAGEMLCADMSRFLDRLRIVVSRLPRVLTDQTATVSPVESADPIEVMLPIVRQMQSAESPGPGG